MERKLRVASEEQEPEVFYTIQGEGRNTGEPSVFLRLSECNLQCNWCDTPYTWNFDGTPYEHDDDIKYSREEQQIKLTVGETIDRLTQEKSKHVVISGGEPMIQQKQLVELITGLKEEDEDYRVDIETNGTVTPNEDMRNLVDLFTVSPKLENSGNTQAQRDKATAMEAFSNMDNADFKFVVSSPDDIQEILGLIDRYGIKPEKVFLMPEGRTREELAQHRSMVADLAIEYQFNLTGRMHIELWGDKRGV